MGPARATLRPSAAVNIVCDGNSLVDGVGASDYAGVGLHAPTRSWPGRLAALPPVAGSGATVVNLGVSGQTWRQMDGLDGGDGLHTAADVDGAFAAGRTNVLIAMETTNSIYVGRTPAQACADAAAYFANRLARHPWLPVVVLAPPRRVAGASQAAIDATNDAIVAANGLIRAAAPGWGVRRVIDLRLPGGHLDLPDWTLPRFAAWPTLWAEAGDGQTHWTDAGYANVAAIIAAHLRQLPAR